MTARPIRIPEHWKYLRVGEQVHSRLPLHRIEAIAEKMRGDGFAFKIGPTPTGYFVLCTERPAIDRDAEIAYASEAL